MLAMETREVIKREIQTILNAGGPRGSQQTEKVRSLLRQGKGLDGNVASEREQRHLAIFDRALRHGIKHMADRDRAQFDTFQKERREMSDTDGGAFPGSPNSFLVPALFEQQVWQMMRQTDRLFDPDVVTFITSDRGGPMSVPMLDDTSSEASVIAQGQQTTQREPETLGQLSFDTATTWESGLWKVSRSLMADSAVDIPDLFASTSATRFRRGIGKSFVTTLLNAATLGAVANGSASNDGIGGPVGTDDLHALLDAVDPEYLSSPKARWLMSFKTYQSLLLQIKDKQGRPILREMYNEVGEPMLLGRPIALCPAMASVSTTFSSPPQTVIPIAVGDLSRFVVRVAGPMRIVRMDERFAEVFQVGFESFVRADAGLMVTAGSDSPVKYLTTLA